MGNKSVCVNCRIALSYYGMDFYTTIIARTCPQCKHEMIQVHSRLRPPKKRDIKKWEVIAYLLDQGFYFQHIFGEDRKPVKYPENIKDAKGFVENYQSQSMRKWDKK